MADRTFGDAPIPLAAAASSGLPVSFSIVSGAASLSNNVLTLTGAGSVTLRATQPGNAQFNAAPPDQLAAQRREAELRLATNQIENAKTTVAIQTAEEDARKVELRKKASEAAVQVKLAPFIQKGYWQIVGYSTEPKPLSFTALQSIGALDVSIKGMGALIRIATRQDDKVRSRWKLVGGSVYFQKYPESMEKVKEAQNLLIELGPVLVEMGKLQP